MVVGLGNPGRRYERTPHNVGFAVVDRLARASSCTLRRSLRFRARLGRACMNGEPTLLLEPRTFMNNSGEAVAGALRYFRLSPPDMVLVLDDAALQLGLLRVRSRGSSGGHRGLESIIRSLNSEDFTRVRMGIGRPEEERSMVEHVLTPFSEREWRRMSEVIERAADAVRVVLSAGTEEAMNRFNGMAPVPADA